jgi:cysteine desulfurase / selenocysteine lyase
MSFALQRQHDDAPFAAAPFDAEAVRNEFPILATEAYGQRLIYLDNAATTQKPRCVLQAMQRMYEESYANVHRGVHLLSQRATDTYEAARNTVARFIGAASAKEIIFVRGATEGINLAASSLGRRMINPGDEIIISHLEHHSNIVPWQFVREDRGAVLKVIPVDDSGALRLDVAAEMITSRCKVVAITHVSNALGTVTPLRELIARAHQVGALVLADGCQAAPHIKLDMRDLDIDFYVFSGHKIYGPTGIGVLYGKYDLLNSLPPYQGGGEMISQVTFDVTTYKNPPLRFEAGTPAIVEAAGLAAAMDFIDDIGVSRISQHESMLLDYATQRIANVPGMHIIGTAQPKAAILSFIMDGAHAHDVGTILDRSGIAIRAGHHCAQPLMDRLGLAATARASFALYNTRADVDALVDGLHAVRKIFGS